MEYEEFITFLGARYQEKLQDLDEDLIEVFRTMAQGNPDKVTKDEFVTFMKNYA